MPKPKMRLTIQYQVEYEADPKMYETVDPREMAAIDEEAAGQYPHTAIKTLAAHVGGRFKVRVMHVESPEDKTGLKVNE